MTNIKRTIALCFCAVFLSLGIFALDKIEYKVPEDNTVITVNEVFLAAINDDELPSVYLHADNAEWCFENYSLSRNAFAWLDFDSKIDVLPDLLTTDKEVEEIKNINGIFIDAKPGPAYPGLADICVTSDLINGEYSVFQIIYGKTDDGGENVEKTYLRHLTDKQSLLGHFSFAVSENTDFVLVPTEEYEKNKAAIDKFVSHIDCSGEDTGNAQNENSGNAIAEFLNSDKFFIAAAIIVLLCIAMIIFTLLYKKRARK